MSWHRLAQQSQSGIDDALFPAEGIIIVTLFPPAVQALAMTGI